MIISIIAALAKNNVIGKKNALPWNLPADLARFREITTGKPVIMGKNTYDSIGRPLPNRLNIVLSNDRNSKIEGCLVANSLEETLNYVLGAEEVMIIGGASIYKQFLPVAARMYLTRIHHDFEGDVYFPEFDEKEWQENSREDFKADLKNPYNYSFITLEKKLVG